MLSRIPIPIRFITKAVPPCETNGSGKPFIGIKPVIPVVLRNTCVKIQTPIPVAIILPSRSIESLAIIIARANIHRYKPKKAIVPTNPTSSPITFYLL